MLKIMYFDGLLLNVNGLEVAYFAWLPKVQLVQISILFKHNYRISCPLRSASQD